MKWTKWMKWMTWMKWNEIKWNEMKRNEWNEWHEWNEWSEGRKEGMNEWMSRFSMKGMNDMFWINFIKIIMSNHVTI